MTDTVTIVRCRAGLLLAKRVASGGMTNYDSAKHVDLLSRPVDGLGDLEELLRLLGPRPRLAVVRGETIDPAHAGRRAMAESAVRRNAASGSLKSGRTCSSVRSPWSI